MQSERSKAMCHESEDPTAPPSELYRQSQVMRAIGTPFVADLLAAVDRQLDNAPLSAALIRSWGSTAASSAIAMRVNAALHALARRGVEPQLAALYAGRHSRFDEAVALALASHDEFLVDWLLRVPQTNEVGRAAALHAALMVLAEEYGHGFELFEIGASAGLNLNLARYAYDLGGLKTGEANSTVRIAPAWRGPTPPDAVVTVCAARGVDLHPLDAKDPAACERLAFFVFADQPERATRLEQALDIARRHPPRLDTGDAARWLAAQVAKPGTDHQHRVALHSMVLQYLRPEDRMAIEATLLRAGAAATAARPFACIGFEWDDARERVELRLRSWPDGRDRVLAHCHPYGAWIEWLAA